MNRAQIKEFVKSTINDTTDADDKLQKSRVGMRNLVDSNPEIADMIHEFDTTFLRKIRRWPGDITAVRIKKVLTKLNEAL